MSTEKAFGNAYLNSHCVFDCIITNLESHCAVTRYLGIPAVIISTRQHVHVAKLFSNRTEEDEYLCSREEAPTALETAIKPFGCTVSMHSVSPGMEERQLLGAKFNDDDEVDWDNEGEFVTSVSSLLAIKRIVYQPLEEALVGLISVDFYLKPKRTWLSIKKLKRNTQLIRALERASFNKAECNI